MYWEMIDRNLGVITTTEQQKLQNSCIGIAGCGGMGGIAAAWLARNGVGHIKIADNQVFDVSNLNRQFAAKLHTIGQNKAEATFKEMRQITEETQIDVFPEGVNANNIEQFVKGCDIICDEIEFFELKPRIMLHKLAREKNVPVLNCNVVGWGTRIFKFLPKGFTMEEFLEADENTQLNEGVVMRMVNRLAPDLPKDISQEILRDWVVKKHKAPIFGGTPLLSAGVLMIRLCLDLIGYQDRPWISELPPMPAYGFIDASRFISYIKIGKWW